MISVCNEVKPLPTWNFHKISLTYLSDNLASPLQLPFRDTVPRSHIIAEGTGRRFPRIEWATFTSDYWGIGDFPFLGKRRRRYEELLTPRGHRHFLSSCGKMRHDVVQPSKITSLLESNLPLSDEFILSPNRINSKEVIIMKEKNHFVKEPVYSSHVSRNEMFPKSRIEYDCPPLAREFRQKQPLSDTTRQGLMEVANRRYKVTSYANHYPGFYFNKQEQENSEVKSKKRILTPKHESYSYNKPTDKHTVKGVWPCWPTSNNYIVSDATGQIVEKKDVVSSDDKRDCRMDTTPTSEKILYEPHQSGKFNSFASKNYVPNTTVNIYGCGPGTIGNENVDREIPSGVRNHRDPQVEDLQRIPRRLAVWEPSTHVCEKKVIKPPPSNNYSLPSQQPCEYGHQKYLQKLQSLDRNVASQNIDYSMQERWALDKKMDRLRERMVCCPTSPETEIEKSESELELEDIEEKDDNETSSDKHVTFTSEPISDELEQKNDVYPISPYFTTRTNYGWEKTVEPLRSKDNLLVSLELAQNTRKVSDLLESVTACDKDREIKELRRKANQMAKLEKVEEERCAADNFTRAYNSSSIKLPPEPLWTSLQYDGDRVPDRLGVRFKTVASKRYHGVYPEPVPDLRELRPTLRKSRILGYHTSIFR